jgi:rhodanese-related sulfurtransferase
MAAFSFFSRNNNENIKSLKPSEFRELISENTIQLVDVRTSEEYNQRKIEGAQLIDIYDPTFEEIIDNTLDASIPVAVYCHSGVRSMSAARLLAKKGFTVYNLRGGMLFWK